MRDEGPEARAGGRGLNLEEHQPVTGMFDHCSLHTGFQTVGFKVRVKRLSVSCRCSIR